MIKEAITMIKEMHLGTRYLDESVERVIEGLKALQSRSCDTCKKRILHTKEEFTEQTIYKNSIDDYKMENPNVNYCHARKYLAFNGSCDGLYCDKYELKDTK